MNLTEAEKIRIKEMLLKQLELLQERSIPDTAFDYLTGYSAVMVSISRILLEL